MYEVYSRASDQQTWVRSYVRWGDIANESLDEAARNYFSHPSANAVTGAQVKFVPTGEYRIFEKTDIKEITNGS